jgi:N,N'-diacetyllegionaminate synthase
MNVYIIAEAGVNHNGSIEIAKKMVDQAKKAGADCIKFQTFISGNIVSKYAAKAEYQRKQTDSNESQLGMLKKLELPFNQFIDLYNYCKEQNIDFLSTAFDFESIDFLRSLGMKRWKIPSGDITNLPYLIKIAKFKQPVILSTGMSTIDEIRNTINILNNNNSGEITVLHCTTEYPTSFKDVNLKAIETIRREFLLPVGYSDHTKGIEVSIAAVAMGAAVIEKHFTLDNNMEGPDHKASLEPYELKSMVSSIRNIEAAFGNGKKEPVCSEKRNLEFVRKSIVAKNNIYKGDIFSKNNLTTKRPGNGVNPMKWFDVLGRSAKRDFKEDELIEL